MQNEFLERYCRLTRVSAIGHDAPRRLRQCAALVVGCGALGTASASALVRSGVGMVRLVDRDVVETSNLGDQCLYTEQDAADHRPKAEAAAERLSAFNRDVEVEGRVADYAPDNAEALSDGIKIIIDGSDNLDTKYLINDVAISTGTPWVYAGCAGTLGMVLTTLPGQTHCLRCIWPEPPQPSRVDGCGSMGLLPTTALLVAAIQVTEAWKILLGQTDELLKGLTRVDGWTASTRQVPIPAFKRGTGQCPACGGGDFRYLGGRNTPSASVMCGNETVLVNPGRTVFDFSRLRQQLSLRFLVEGNNDYFRFEDDTFQFLVFSSGRALIHGTDDPVTALALYGRYLSP